MKDTLGAGFLRISYNNGVPRTRRVSVNQMARLRHISDNFMLAMSSGRLIEIDAVSAQKLQDELDGIEKVKTVDAERRING